MNENETVAKAYELRRLTADDVFPMFQIVSKIGVKEFKVCFESPEIKKMIKDALSDEKPVDKDALKNSIGVAVVLDIAGIIVSNLAKCKNDIYQFLAQLSGMTTKDIAELPMVTFFEMIMDVFKKDEFKDFFQVVAKLLK